MSNLKSVPHFRLRLPRRFSQRSGLISYLWYVLPHDFAFSARDAAGIGVLSLPFGLIMSAVCEERGDPCLYFPKPCRQLFWSAGLEDQESVSLRKKADITEFPTLVRISPKSPHSESYGHFQLAKRNIEAGQYGSEYPLEKDPSLLGLNGVCHQ
jgi:hypothetical protein